MPATTELTNDQYQSLPQCSHSKLCNYVSYDSRGIRSTNLLTYKYPKKIEQTDPMLVGTLVDEYFTEGKKRERTDSTYGEYNIVSRRMGKQENEVLDSFVDTVEEQIQTLTAVTEIMEVIDRSEKQVVFTTDTLFSIPFRGKIDLYDKPKKCLIDLKTSGLTIESFEKDFLSWQHRIPSVTHRYVRQLATYRLMAREAGYEVDTTQIIFSGSDGVKVYEIPEAIISQAEEMVKFDVTDLAQALSENRVVTKFEMPEQAEATTEVSNEDF